MSVATTSVRADRGPVRRTAASPRSPATLARAGPRTSTPLPAAAVEGLPAHLRHHRRPGYTEVVREPVHALDLVDLRADAGLERFGRGVERRPEPASGLPHEPLPLRELA